MNKEIKKAWLAALRSGEYKSGTIFLQFDNRYNVWGVLCDLHSHESGIEWVRLPGEGRRLYTYIASKHLFTPCQKVISWAGLTEYDLDKINVDGLTTNEGLDIIADKVEIKL